MSELIISPQNGIAELHSAAVNPLTLLLADKRSEQTRRAYQGDIADFFQGTPTPEEMFAFAAQSPPQIALRLLEYKNRMLAEGKAEATVNRRLSAVRALLKLCHRIGVSSTDGRGLVDSERVQTYRDTRGINLKQMQALLKLPDTSTLVGKRDGAILRLLCENALRREEVCSLEVADFEPTSKVLRILGKGRGTQKEPVTITPRVVGAINLYLIAAGHTEGQLFRSLDLQGKARESGITGDGIYKLVAAYGLKIGVRLTPHKLRHSAITLALDVTNGDMRRVQKLSRHKDIRTLTIYDDNREDQQGQVTDLLSKQLK